MLCTMTAEKIIVGIIIMCSLFFAMRHWYYQGYIDGLKDAQRIIKETFKKND